jgi:hypothetical protein
MWNSAMKVTLSFDTAFYSYHVGSMCLRSERGSSVYGRWGAWDTCSMQKPGRMQQRETCSWAIST